LCEWTLLLDASRFEELQGLKPQESSKSVVAAKAATYKAKKQSVKRAKFKARES